MRYPIWKKTDFFFINGSRIDMDASVVELPLEPLGVFRVYSHATPIALATDFQLVDGEISAEISFLDPFFELSAEDGEKWMKDNDYRMSGLFNRVEMDKKKAVVSKASLRRVDVGPRRDIPSERENRG